MSIEEAIKKSKNMSPVKGGSNKKCYIIDDYALLVGSSVDRDNLATEKINKIQNLKNEGINVIITIEVKTISGIDYELQERAPGEELYDYYDMKSSEAGQLKYLKRLISLSEESIDFYMKFLNDWDSLLKSGIAVDPCKMSNFFYEKGKGIYFVDLNILTSKYEDRKEYMYYEAASVLRGGSLLWMCNLVEDQAIEYVKIIYQKLGIAIIKLNGNIDEYINRIDPENEYSLKSFFENFIENKARYNK